MYRSQSIALVTDLRKAAGAAVDTEIYFGKVLVACSFRTFLDAKIPGISIHDPIVFTQ